MEINRAVALCRPSRFHRYGRGHEYFGTWYEHQHPKIHDAITDSVEEFRTRDSGLGYDEAQTGGTFVRIGIGTVRKPNEKGRTRCATQH
jgi:hypothetical protein